MNRLTRLQALGMWVLISFFFFLLASLFSWSFSDWNWFSKIVFWGPTIILGSWTINDYFINPYQ